ncbi:DUF1553 domain-containing protein [Maioricimonas sp. JC845]|uniref:DUF1553 domain-containing protein n=1 Tax=Maioricimonas sp. JC845 TaxID=3232138 RepID=UPI00345A3368
MSWHTASVALCCLVLFPTGSFAADLFRDEVAPILQSRCVSCHSDDEKSGGLSLQSAEGLKAGGDSGAAIVAGDPQSSPLIDAVTPEDGEAAMPQDGDPLSPDELAVLRRWVAQGAKWPDGLILEEAAVTDTDWWSLKPLMRPPLPTLSDEDAAWCRTPVDRFIRHQQRERGLTSMGQADRRTLIRRLYFDLIGLPPTYDEVEAFVADTRPQAYERLVDRLLASPHYGERWARHWLDVVHYGDTHGYDKDKPRPNAWPYRDYVIRSFNEDKPYTQFVQEQIAGDVIASDSPDGVIATGFIAAGPWDFISHVEVPESKIDGQIARHLDRDDMVRNTMETFCSVTVGCARCHNHKFDPITQDDYYSLQAVFAAVDRANRPYDLDSEAARRRQELLAQKGELSSARTALEKRLRKELDVSLDDLNHQIAELEQAGQGHDRPEYGYHSQIESRPDVEKWVQVDLGESHSIERIVYVACHDTYNNIGAGFGFPPRYRIDVSDDPDFESGVTTILDRTGSDQPNPGAAPQTVIVSGPGEAGSEGVVSARYVRITATELAPRRNDYIFALAELMVVSPDGQNLAAGRTVIARDSIEAPVRWRKSNLVDGYWYGATRSEENRTQLADLYRQRQELLAALAESETQQKIDLVNERLAGIERQLKDLPAPSLVYAAATEFQPQGNFKATGGAPREIRVLRRGNVLSPGEIAPPGTIAAIAGGSGHFDLPSNHTEGDRRAALARWITDRNNPLTWRSIVNRIWLYHFGRGLVDTPNDFGRMGQEPTHPDLIDWLACEFRDGGESIKHLHRLIVCSATYRQASRPQPRDADIAAANEQIDGGNQYLWRMNPRRLEAEAIRDAVLQVSGRLDLKMYGPGFQDFVIEKPQHSPHYQYHLHDPTDSRTHRRAVYRFLVRSQQQPFMTTLDCADPSMQVEKRNETLTPQQALALMNNSLMVVMAEQFAESVAGEQQALPEQVRLAFRRTLSRDPQPQELKALIAYGEQHGLNNVCRVLLNLNEFVFVD